MCKDWNFFQQKQSNEKSRKLITSKKWLLSFAILFFKHANLEMSKKMSNNLKRWATDLNSKTNKFDTSDNLTPCLLQFYYCFSKGVVCLPYQKKGDKNFQIRCKIVIFTDKGLIAD